MQEHEFGHFAASGPGVRIDVWGAGPFHLTVGDKVYRFEDSNRFGPWPLTRDGFPKSVGYSPRSPFWPAWTAWRDQGRRVADDGVTCIWEGPTCP